jgi:hypothetical protein
VRKMREIKCNKKKEKVGLFIPFYVIQAFK